MTKDEIKQLTADIINGKKTIKDINPGRDFFVIQNILLNMGNLQLVADMADLAGQRLERKGFKLCIGLGWLWERDIPNMGIGYIRDRWVVTNVDKFKNYGL